MDEQRAGEGGPANSPPFPRAAGPDSAPVAEPIGPGSEPESSPEEEPAGPYASADDDSPLPRRRPEALRGHARRLASSAGEEVRRRAERGLHRGFERIADRLEDAADRIDTLAEQRSADTGARHRAAAAAHSTAGWMGDAADYLRSRDLVDLHADLEERVRARPVQTLLLAAAFGWVVGKVMR